ncbi:MAG TPA: amidohydrolase family protein [Longimicrobiaceae bacterium]|nr:amidohydrolase family protein [Longimicrobiaceae bacterium]
MIRKLLSSTLIFLSAACAGRGAEVPPDAGAGGARLFEGARVIVGDGATLERGAFLVEGSRITRVGRAGEVEAPPGSTRIDLSGRTVMPAMIDAHAHLGFEGYTSWGGERYSRENVIDHLERYAYYGFAAVFTAGTDPERMMLELQRDQREGRVGGARVLFAAGMAPPGQGPNAQLLETARALEEPILRGIRTPEEARAAVRDVARAGIPFVKIWVDDRNGTQEKLPRPIFEALIDEAQSHGVKVFAHQQTVADMRTLVAAGAHGFLHGRLGPTLDAQATAELRRSGAFLVPNIGLGERGRDRVFEDPFLRDTLPPAVLARLREGYTARPPASPEQERALRESFQRLLDAGVDIILGTDAGAVADHFFGHTGHRELEIYTRLGMPPAEAIVAATSRPAKHLGLTDMGAIAPGMSADFLVLEANPLDDIRNTRTILDVYLRGERIDRERLRERFVAE